MANEHTVCAKNEFSMTESVPEQKQTARRSRPGLHMKTKCQTGDQIIHSLFTNCPLSMPNRVARHGWHSLRARPPLNPMNGATSVPNVPRIERWQLKAFRKLPC